MQIEETIIDRFISQALTEDMGKGDVTTSILIPKTQVSSACIIFRQEATISGLNIAKKVFRKLDKDAGFKTIHNDGDQLNANTKVLFIKAKTRAILTGERVALNFLSHLSGIATRTRSFVLKTQPYKAHIMDTRKTTPGLRLFEKEAVRHGGGTNHRFDLNAMVLIKDNHRIIYRLRMPLKEMIEYTKKHTDRPVGIEVDNLIEFKQALEAKPDIIMLDNMSLGQIRKAVHLRKKQKSKKHIMLEVSGNVNLRNVRSIAKTGVDRISIGGLTHTKKSIDVSLEIIS